MKIATFTLIISLFCFGGFAQQVPQPTAPQELTAEQKADLAARSLKVRQTLFNWMEANLSLDASQQSRLHEMIIEDDQGVLFISKKTVGRYPNPTDALSEEQRAGVEDHNNKYREELAGILNADQMEIVMSRQTELQEVLKHVLASN